MALRRDFIHYPDDLGHPYALQRAWDRWLLSQGLLPIFTSDVSKVGPILVNPDGYREYYSYGYTNSGVLQANVWEDFGQVRGREREPLPVS